jgi:outer membrane scaffolding protein for murein synthesis (MipA/OmpV family)
MSIHRSIYLRERHPFLLALAISVAAPVAGVRAQETEDFESWSKTIEAEESGETLEPGDESHVRDDWYARIGIIGGAVPGYMGSHHYEGGYAPRLKIVWRDRVFLNDRQLGVNLFKNDVMAMGPFIRYTGGRSENNKGLEGMGDIDRTLAAGGFFNYNLGVLRFKSEIREDILGEKQGMLAIARLGTRIPWGAPVMNVYVSSTWGSSECMQSFFGVDAVQSIRTGLPRYEADAGIRDVSLSVSSGFQFSDNWALNGQVEYQHLLGNAADSPLVEEEGSDDQFVIGLGLNYTF